MRLEAVGYLADRRRSREGRWGSPGRRTEAPRQQCSRPGPLWPAVARLTCGTAEETEQDCENVTKGTIDGQEYCSSAHL